MSNPPSTPQNGTPSTANVPDSDHDATTDATTTDHHPPGYLGDKDKVLARLRRVEGQVRGIERMVSDDTYCIDVLTQVSAATKALQNVALLLLDDHVRHCVANDVRAGSTDKVEEAMSAISRLVRS